MIFVSRTKCKDSCVPSENLSFSRMLVRISKIQLIIPFMELPHNMFYELNTRLLADLKMQINRQIPLNGDIFKPETFS